MGVRTNNYLAIFSLGIIMNKFIIFQSGALGRNRTYNYPLGRDSYIHLTTRADHFLTFELYHTAPFAARRGFCQTVAMTPEERSLLERTCAMTEENNKILHSMRRSNRISTIMRAIYWVIILLVGFGAYYFIQPYLTTMLNLYGQVQGGFPSVQGAQDAANSFKDLWK